MSRTLKEINEEMTDAFRFPTNESYSTAIESCTKIKCAEIIAEAIAKKKEAK